MDLTDLRCFVTVINELSFTKAARAMNMTQSALSRRISSLEASLGVQLLLRTPRSMQLTGNGQELLERAKLIIREVDFARESIKKRARAVKSSLRIGAPGTLASLAFPQLLRESRRLHPLVTLHIMERRSPELLTAMDEGLLDLALIFSPHPMTHKTVTPLLIGKVVAVLPKNHPLTANQYVTMKELSDEDFISLAEPGEPFDIEITDMCIRDGFIPNIVLSGVDPRTAVQLVAAHMGIAIMSAISANQVRDREVKWVELANPEAMSAVSLVTPSEQATSEEAADFNRLIYSWAREHQSESRF